MGCVSSLHRVSKHTRTTTAQQLHSSSSTNKNFEKSTKNPSIISSKMASETSITSAVNKQPSEQPLFFPLKQARSIKDAKSSTAELITHHSQNNNDQKLKTDDEKSPKKAKKSKKTKKSKKQKKK